jgi:hypothetical protein
VVKLEKMNEKISSLHNSNTRLAFQNVNLIYGQSCCSSVVKLKKPNEKTPGLHNSNTKFVFEDKYDLMVEQL